MKRLLVLLTMVVLVFTSQAIAENWVLWEYAESKQISGGAHWYILEAFPSYELCIKEWDKQVSLSALAVNAKKLEKGTFLIKNENGSTTLVEFKCLPDTVDPRK